MKILPWLLTIEILGFVSLPLVSLLFKNFFDLGFCFAKILGILLVSYLTWILGSLHFLPFTRATLIGITVLLGVLNLGLLRYKKRLGHESLSVILIRQLAEKDLDGILQSLRSFRMTRREQLGSTPKKFPPGKKYLKIFLLEELMFLGCLLFWSFIRGFRPDIFGLEKYMDFGFLNSILRSRFFPPKDPWFAGNTINYYYFGHLVTAVLTKLSGIDSAITYNLMIATLFALCFTASFSITGNLLHKVKSKWVIAGGVLSAFLLCLGSNLHPLWYFLKYKGFSNYWYPDATRFIVKQFGAADNTIHEFPSYSFVVADLHGHLLNLPFVLLFLAIVFAIFTQKKLSLYRHIFISLLLAVFFMTNPWDFPIYFLILAVVTFWLNYKKYGATIKTIYKSLLYTISYILYTILFSLPFHLSFKSIAKGISFVDFRSPPWMLFILWGFPLIITISHLLFLKIKTSNIKHQTPARQSLRLQALAGGSSINVFILILIAISWLLVLIPEIVYVKDIYTHSFQRANTMFKLTYQSFVMFSLASGYIIIRVLTNLKQNLFKFLYVIFLFSFLIFIFIYPYFATRSYYGLKNYQGLYGLSYLQKSYPYDFEAILWLKKKILRQPVILEGVGDSYTEYGRVSANTGLPTVLGWPVHEWLWQGGYEKVGKRKTDVQTIYETSDISLALKLLKRYKVEYVYLGALEKEKYPKLKAEKFKKLGEIIYENERVEIYSVF